MLLNTDGSVTALLEASFRAPVAVETRSNAVDEGRLHRTAILRLASDGRPLLRAVSRSRSTACRRKTRRELGPCNADIATAEDAADLGVVPRAPVYERSYRIVSGACRLATITERFPAGLFEVDE
jgi:chorismate-pyruvate lyase